MCVQMFCWYKLIHTLDCSDALTSNFTDVIEFQYWGLIKAISHKFLGKIQTLPQTKFYDFLTYFLVWLNVLWARNIQFRQILISWINLEYTQLQNTFYILICMDY